MSRWTFSMRRNKCLQKDCKSNRSIGNGSMFHCALKHRSSVTWFDHPIRELTHLTLWIAISVFILVSERKLLREMILNLLIRHLLTHTLQTHTHFIRIASHHLSQNPHQQSMSYWPDSQHRSHSGLSTVRKVHWWLQHSGWFFSCDWSRSSGRGYTDLWCTHPEQQQTDTIIKQT